MLRGWPSAGSYAGGSNSSGGGGGGFFSGMSPGSFSSQAPRENKFQRSNTLIPCTTAQIHQMSETDEHLKVGSIEAQMVCVIGIVRFVDEADSKITYLIDDMTGPPLEVCLWLGEDSNFTNEMRTTIIEGAYARVVGAVRMVKGNRFLTVFSISPVKQMNELTVHLLEILHVQMAVATMDKRNAAAAVGGVEQMDTNQSFTAGSMGNFSDNVMLGLNKTQQLILQVIAGEISEDGISLQNICNSLPSLNRTTIRSTLEFLSNEGHVYTTIDDDHYKATDTA